MDQYQDKNAMLSIDIIQVRIHHHDYGGGDGYTFIVKILLYASDGHMHEAAVVN